MKGLRNSSASYVASDSSNLPRDLTTIVEKQSASTPIPMHPLVNTSIMQ